MKAALDCIHCFQRQALEAARMASDDLWLHEKITREVMGKLLAMDWDKRPTEISGIVHGIVKEISGNADPYKRVKKEYNDIALKMYLGLEKIVKNSQDPIQTAVRLAIAGNVIDFAVSSEFDLDGAIDSALARKFAIDDMPALKEELESGREILYIADNAGEIVFDRLLLETILSCYSPRKIKFVVKASPVVNDVTLDDARYVGIDKIPNLEFIEVGPGLERTSGKFKEIVENNLTISKGQGNYEALSEVETIFFLFMVKCMVVARDLEVGMGGIVLKRG